MIGESGPRHKARQGYSHEDVGSPTLNIDETNKLLHGDLFAII